MVEERLTRKEYIADMSSPTPTASCCAPAGGPKLLSRPGFVYFRNVTVDGTSSHLVNCSMFLRYRVTEPVTTYHWYFPSTTS